MSVVARPPAPHQTLEASQSGSVTGGQKHSPPRCGISQGSHLHLPPPAGLAQASTQPPALPCPGSVSLGRPDQDARARGALEGPRGNQEKRSLMVQISGPLTSLRRDTPPSPKDRAAPGACQGLRSAEGHAEGSEAEDTLPLHPHQRAGGLWKSQTWGRSRPFLPAGPVHLRKQQDPVTVSYRPKSLRRQCRREGGRGHPVLSAHPAPGTLQRAVHTSPRLPSTAPLPPTQKQAKGTRPEGTQPHRGPHPCSGTPVPPMLGRVSQTGH